jgi:hypothetical protein
LWKVGIVQPTSEEGVDGFGLSITDDEGRPVASFAIETRADAEVAATHAQEVVKNAISVRGFNFGQCFGALPVPLAALPVSSSPACRYSLTCRVRR